MHGLVILRLLVSSGFRPGLGHWCDIGAGSPLYSSSSSGAPLPLLRCLWRSHSDELYVSSAAAWPTRSGIPSLARIASAGLFNRPLMDVDLFMLREVGTSLSLAAERW